MKSCSRGQLQKAGNDSYKLCLYSDFLKDMNFLRLNLPNKTITAT